MPMLLSKGFFLPQTRPLFRDVYITCPKHPQAESSIDPIDKQITQATETAQKVTRTTNPFILSQASTKNHPSPKMCRRYMWDCPSRISVICEGRRETGNRRQRVLTCDEARRTGTCPWGVSEITNSVECGRCREQRGRPRELSDAERRSRRAANVNANRMSPDERSRYGSFQRMSDSRRAGGSSASSSSRTSRRRERSPVGTSQDPYTALRSARLEPYEQDVLSYVGSYNQHGYAPMGSYAAQETRSSEHPHWQYDRHSDRRASRHRSSSRSSSRDRYGGSSSYGY